MKRTLFLLILLAWSLSAGAQTIARGGEDRPITAVVTAPGFALPVLMAQSAVTINICAHPANAVPCTNLVTTYSDSTGGSPCPSNAQLTWAGTSSCTSTTDAYGNWGVWVRSGTYDFTVTLLNGTSSGPYTMSIGNGSGGGGSVVVPGAQNDILMSNGAQGFQIDTGIFYEDPVTHTVHAYAFQSDSTNPFILTMLPSGSTCTAGPTGKVQLDICPGPDVQWSYSGDGPFSAARWGTIGTALALPASRFYPLDANSSLPLGSLGDAGLQRVAPGVLENLNPADNTKPSKFIAVAQCWSGNCGQGGMNWNSTNNTVDLFSEKTGSAQYPNIRLCPQGNANCSGWIVAGGSSTPGLMYPVASNSNPNIGDPGLGQPNNIFLKQFLVNSGTYITACTNDATGTQIGLFAKRSATGVADSNGYLECEAGTTSDTTGGLGVVVGESTGGTCGVGAACTTGIAYVAFKGQTAATFDGSVTVKHWAIASTSTAGNLSDSGTACGSARPSGVDVYGCIDSTNSGAGSYKVDLNFFSALSTSGANSPNLYTETSTAGTTTNSASSTPVNIFTGYTVPANKLTAGHSLHVTGCFKHTTGTTGTTYAFTLGGSSFSMFSGSTGVSAMCINVVVAAVDSTHQTALIIPGSGPTGSVSVPQVANLTATLSSTAALNFTQSAAGTADVYTAYLLTVDLY